jgi:hypothetical protein
MSPAEGPPIWPLEMLTSKGKLATGRMPMIGLSSSG